MIEENQELQAQLKEQMDEIICELQKMLQDKHSPTNASKNLSHFEKFFQGKDQTQLKIQNESLNLSQRLDFLRNSLSKVKSKMHELETNTLNSQTEFESKIMKEREIYE